MQAGSKKNNLQPSITVICDNYTTRNDLTASWGFSCLIRHGGRKILFDAGGDGIVLAENMSKLGIDPASVDLLMISHQHWDHTGGIYHILNAKRNVPVCVPSSFSAHFKADIKRYGVELIEIKEVCEIIPGFYSTGDLEGPIREQAAFLQTPAGTVVVTGCAHPGVVRIAKIAKNVLPDEELALVMGGFHLLFDLDADVLKTINQFKAMGVRFAAASHCSGERARQLFAHEYQNHFISLGAGSVIKINDLQ